MDQARQGANLLGGYFDHVDVALKRAEDSLNIHFERCYGDKDVKSESSQRYNPVMLLARLKSLQVELPELKRRTLATFDTSTWLPNAILDGTTAASCALLAAIVQPEDDVEVLREETEETDSKLKDALEKHHEALKEFQVRSEVMRERTLLTDIPEAPPLDFSNTEGTAEEAEIEEESPRPQPPAETAVPKVSKKRSMMRKTSTRGTSRKAATAVSPKEDGKSGKGSGDGFKAIEKNAFNRLPRNKKFGKLAELNEFYKNVHAALTANGGPMEEESLLEAAGETNGNKLKSLWGLSILRQSDKGWEFAKKK